MLEKYKVRGFASDAVALAELAIKRGVGGTVIMCTNENMRYSGLLQLFEPMLEAAILALEAGEEKTGARVSAENAYYREAQNLSEKDGETQ